MISGLLTPPGTPGLVDDQVYLGAMRIAFQDIAIPQPTPALVEPGFLHTSPVHVPTFEALLAEVAPSARALSVVDEQLLADARQLGPAAVADRVATALRGLRDHGASIVCCTCSTIGEVAEQVDVGIPVFRVDRPMAVRAVQTGARVGVVAAVEHLAARLSPGSLPGAPLLDPVDGRPDAVLASHRCLDLLRSCQHPISLLDG